jgi:hypothetical protein
MAMYPVQPEEAMPRPACTPAAVRAVLAAHADAEVLERYDNELDRAFEQARQSGELSPLIMTVRRWWFEADAWRDPAAQREYLSRVERYVTDGPPPADQRVGREAIRARYGI